MVNYFGAGKIYVLAENSTLFRVESIKDLEVVINHFDKYPLLTQKFKDYLLFKHAFNIVKNKEHLTLEGIRQIISIKDSLNLGLSENLKEVFPNITTFKSEDVELCSDTLMINWDTVEPYWLVGFTSGEGCFFINMIKSKSKLNEQVQLVFQITQHTRDEILMKNLISYFGCGYIKVKTSSKFSWLDFVVTKFSDIDEKIIPFFKKYGIFGVKLEDFEDWSKAAELVKNKTHLTSSGLEEIWKIKTGMNRGRGV